MDVRDAYISWVNGLRSPHTIKSYRGNLKRFCLAVWGKEPQALTFDDLKGITVREVNNRFYFPMRERGHKRTTISRYYGAVKGFVDKINQLEIFTEKINTEKFVLMDNTPTKGDLLKRLDELENEIADIRAILAAYEAS